MLLLLFVMAPVGGTQASSPSGDAVTSAKLPKCKLGKVNKKKCRCPQGYKRRKVKKGFKCVKVKPPEEQEGDDPFVPPVDDGGETDQGGTDEPQQPDPPAQPDKVRDDQALLSALSGNAAVKYYSGGGYGSYAYNFLTETAGTEEGITAYQMRYCTFYYATGFGNSRDNYNGLWAVKEGYTHPGQPGVVTGVLYLVADGKYVETPVQISGSTLTLPDLSQFKPFEGGEYNVRQGQATTDCSVYET